MAFPLRRLTFMAKLSTPCAPQVRAIARSRAVTLNSMEFTVLTDILTSHQTLGELRSIRAVGSLSDEGH